MHLQIHNEDKVSVSILVHQYAQKYSVPRGEQSGTGTHLHQQAFFHRCAAHQDDLGADPWNRHGTTLFGRLWTGMGQKQPRDHSDSIDHL